MHHQAGWHPSHASGNISGTSVIFGIIGMAINPLLGIVGLLFGEGLHNCCNKQPPHKIPFWAYPIEEIRKVNPIYGMSKQEIEEYYSNRMKEKNK